MQQSPAIEEPLFYSVGKCSASSDPGNPGDGGSRFG
jgi:hypothetical protein